MQRLHFGEENATFCGTFASDCQDLTATARLLVSMILCGPDLSIDIRESQACNTISQLLIHNAKKRTRKEEANCSRHAPERELNHNMKNSRRILSILTARVLMIAF